VNGVLAAVRSKPDESAQREAFPALLESWQARMGFALAARLPNPGEVPMRLHQAMRYSVLGGGRCAEGEIRKNRHQPA
jgi:hypothetical protein